MEDGLPKDTKIDLVSVGKYSVIVKTVDDKYYQMGNSKFGHLKEADGATDKLIEIDGKMAILKREKVTQMISGSHFTLFLTDDGKVFGRGDQFLKIIGIDAKKEVKQIPIAEKYTVKKMYCNQGNSKEGAVVILEVYDSENKIKKYLSAGKNRFGLLG